MKITSNNVIQENFDLSVKQLVGYLNEYPEFFETLSYRSFFTKMVEEPESFGFKKNHLYLQFGCQTSLDEFKDFVKGLNCLNPSVDLYHTSDEGQEYFVIDINGLMKGAFNGVKVFVDLTDIIDFNDTEDKFISYMSEACPNRLFLLLGTSGYYLYDEVLYPDFSPSLAR